MQDVIHNPQVELRSEALLTTVPDKSEIYNWCAMLSGFVAVLVFATGMVYRLIGH